MNEWMSNWLIGWMKGCMNVKIRIRGIHSTTLKMDGVFSSTSLLLVDRNIRCLVQEHHNFDVGCENINILWKMFYFSLIKMGCRMSCVRACVFEGNFKSGFWQTTLINSGYQVIPLSNTLAYTDKLLMFWSRQELTWSLDIYSVGNGCSAIRNMGVQGTTGLILNENS